MARFGSAGGKTTITSPKIKLQPHKLNSTAVPFQMERSDIAGFERYDSMGIIPNVLLIRTQSGADLRFVVINRKGAIAILEGCP